MMYLQWISFNSDELISLVINTTTAFVVVVSHFNTLNIWSEEYDDLHRLFNMFP